MSPITDPSAYPDDWPEIRERILLRSSETDVYWCDGKPRCECTGECGLHLHEDDGGRCLEQHGEKALGFKGDVVLTVAHRNHDAASSNHANGELFAACQRCHLRYDAEHNRRKAANTRREKATAGMVPLFGGEV